MASFSRLNPFKNLCRPTDFGGKAVEVKLLCALCECIDILTGPHTHAACVSNELTLPFVPVT